MKPLSFSLMAAMVAAALVVANCSPAAPPAPTQAPAAPKAAAPTTAPAAAPAPTQAAAPAAPKVEYPTKGKVITWIIPLSVGGSTDLSVRIMAPAMEKVLGTTVEAVNKAGASTQVGITELVKSKPDGYTIGCTLMPSGAMTYLDPQRQATYGRKDFQLVAAWAWEPVIWMVKPDSPYKTLKDLVDAEKAKAGSVSFGTTSIGGSSHLSYMLFQNQIGIPFTLVPFDNNGQLRSALLGGTVTVELGTIGDFLPQIKAGEIRPLVVLQEKENKYLPGIGTSVGQGFNFTMGSIYGFSVPAGTPKEIMSILSAAQKKTLEDSTVIQKIGNLGMEINYLDTPAFEKAWEEGEAKLKPLVAQLQKK